MRARPTCAVILTCAVIGPAGAACHGSPGTPAAPVAPVTVQVPLTAATAETAAAAVVREQLVPPWTLTASDGSGLVLARVDAKAVLEGPLAYTELHLYFRNDEDRVREGTFQITLPPRAAVSRFAMENAGEWMEGEVVAKLVARRAYDDFLHRRQDPALLEKAAGNQFTAKVFPIAAKATKHLVISYSQELPGVPYTLPLRGLPAVERVDVELAVAGGERTERLTERSWQPDRDFVAGGARAAAAVGAGSLVAAEVAIAGSAGREAPTGLTLLVDTSASRALGFAAYVASIDRLIGELRRRWGDALPLAVVAFDQDSELVFAGRAAAFGQAERQRLVERGAAGASDLGQALAWIAEAPRRTALQPRVVIVGDGVITAGAEGEGLAAAVARLSHAGVERLDVVLAGGLRDERTAAQLVRAGLPRAGAVLDLDADPVAAALAEPVAVDVPIEIAGASWVFPRVIASARPGAKVMVFARLAKPVTSIEVIVGGAHSVLPVLSGTEPLVERAVAGAELAELEAKLPGLKSSDAAAARRDIAARSIAARVLSSETSLLVLESDEDYARYGIERTALADVLVIGPRGVERRHRTGVALVPAGSARRGAMGTPRREGSGADMHAAHSPMGNDAAARRAAVEHPVATSGGAAAHPVAASGAATHPAAGSSGAAVELRAGSGDAAAPPAAASSAATYPVPGSGGAAGELRAGSGDAVADPIAGSSGAAVHPVVASGDRNARPREVPSREVPPAGEPVADRDGEGIPDSEGIPDGEGIPDSDHDGIPDDMDGCPDEPESYNGFEDGDGCPDRGRVIMTSASIEILDSVYFAPDSAAIEPASRPILDAVAATLQGNPDIARVEIQGHSDERGDARYNLELSDRRAAAVKQYLVGAGVEEHRLSAQGYGASQPLDRGHAASAWARNRRVAFLILQRADEPARAAGDAGTARPAPRKPPEPPPAVTGELAAIEHALAAHEIDAALARARDWHAREPGNVLALIGLGEALEARGAEATAARVYGSIIDLFPGRADMRRFAGERLARLPGARLLAVDTFRRAVADRPDHLTGHRLLAYALVRAGQPAEAFAAVLAGLDQPVRGGSYAGGLRVLGDDAAMIGAAYAAATPAKRAEIAAALARHHLAPATQPSTRFVLYWETDANDVDLHVRDARGGHAYFQQRTLASGGELYADVTTGYGPECFAIPGAPRAGPYQLSLEYYAQGPMGYGMGLVEIQTFDPARGFAFDDRPYVIMTDHARVDLGAYR